METRLEDTESIGALRKNEWLILPLSEGADIDLVTIRDHNGRVVIGSAVVRSRENSDAWWEFVRSIPSVELVASLLLLMGTYDSSETLLL